VGVGGRPELERDIMDEGRNVRAAAAAAAAAAEAQAPVLVATPGLSPAAASVAAATGLPYDNSLSPSTSLTSITTYEEEGAECDHEEEEEGDSSFASCWTPDTEAPTEADTTTERRGSDDDDVDVVDYRIRPYGEGEESEGLAPGMPSHFAPSRSQKQQRKHKHKLKQQPHQHQRSRNNRRRRRPGDGPKNQEYSDDIAASKATALTRRISSDTFDSVAIGEGAKKIKRRGGIGHCPIYCDESVASAGQSLLVCDLGAAINGGRCSLPLVPRFSLCCRRRATSLGTDCWS